MSYVTLEVEIDHGAVVLKGPEKLPEKGKGLLTILEAEPAEPLPATRLDAFRKLQEAVQLTPDKAEAWKAAVRDARR